MNQGDIGSPTAVGNCLPSTAIDCQPLSGAPQAADRSTLTDVTDSGDSCGTAADHRSNTRDTAATSELLSSSASSATTVESFHSHGGNASPVASSSLRPDASPSRSDASPSRLDASPSRSDASPSRLAACASRPDASALRADASTACSDDDTLQSHAYCQPDEPPPETDDQTEEKAFQRICDVFLSYKHWGFERIDRQIAYFHSLPERQQKLLPGFLEWQDKRKSCVDANCLVISKIIRSSEGMFMNVDYSTEIYTQSGEMKWKIPAEIQPPIEDFDMERLVSLLKHFVRDWSTEGVAERELCYKPILDALDERFSGSNKAEIQVLVPGAGLSRLVFEVILRGYSCQGNEFGYLMLMASNFILNHCRTKNECIIYPYCLSLANNFLNDDVTGPVTFPDVSPSDLPAVRGEFSMSAGEFEQVYSDGNSIFDCVLTAFFMDTAHNVLAYIEILKRIVKRGGFWINFGPLMYHFTDCPNENSLELSYEELKTGILEAGFVFEEDRTGCPSYYARSEESMLKNGYKSVFFVCRKT